MSDPKDFVAVVDSDARKTPRRIAFITKRTSPQVRVKDEDRVMTYPEVFFRAAVAIEVLADCPGHHVAAWDAPLEGLADPMHTPNPAKAPWYFLGLQEIAALLPAGGGRRSHTRPGSDGADHHSVLQHQCGSRRACGCATRPSACGSSASSSWCSAFSWWSSMSGSRWFRHVIVAAFMLLAAQTDPQTAQGFRRWLVRKPLSFWIMTWFLFELVVLTAIGTFFRGPGWSWVLPWRA